MLQDRETVSQGEKPMPPKTPGEHRWVALVSYTLTPDEVERAHTGGTVDLSVRNRVAVFTGCYDCEEAFVAAGQTKTPCPAEAAA